MSEAAIVNGAETMSRVVAYLKNPAQDDAAALLRECEFTLSQLLTASAPLLSHD